MPSLLSLSMMSGLFAFMVLSILTEKSKIIAALSPAGSLDHWIWMIFNPVDNYSDAIQIQNFLV